MTIPSAATGTPDWGQNPPSNPTSPVWDMGEAANRELLGGGGQSRSGRWYWATGFETGASQDVNTGGASTVVSNALGAWQGQYALAMQTQASIADVSSAFKYFLAQNSPSGRWGIEAMIACGSRDATFDLILRTASPTAVSEASVRINIPALAANMTLQYLDSAGVYQNLVTPIGYSSQQGANYAVSSQVFHNIKLVADFLTLKYVRIIIDGVPYDLANVDMRAGAAGADVRQFWRMAHTTNIAGVATAVVDNIVLTADEP